MQVLRNQWLAVGFLALAGLAGCDGDETETDAGADAVAPKVTVSPAGIRAITDEFRLIGRIEARDEIDIVPRVSGYLEERPVENGAFVEEGEVLFRVERDRYEADLAGVTADKSQIESELALADIELDRSKQLLASDTVAQSRYDADLAAREALAAKLEHADAQIKLAELNLGYTEIIAPFPGRIGQIAYSVGDTVGPEQGPIVKLVRLSPVDVVFSIPERYFVDLMQKHGDQVGSGGEGTVPVNLTLPNGEVYGESGRIVFVDNTVDRETGSVALRARFANEDEVLTSGIFVNVVLQEEEPTDSLVVPQAAVQRDQKGDFVLVVDAEGSVEQRYIETGQQVETFLAVEGGLSEGDQVIVDGLQRVRPGVAVEAIQAAENPRSALQDPAEADASEEAADSGQPEDTAEDAGTDEPADAPDSSGAEEPESEN